MHFTVITFGPALRVEAVECCSMAAARVVATEAGLSRTPVAAGVATAQVGALGASMVIVRQEEQERLVLCTSSGAERFWLYSIPFQLIVQS